MTVLNVSNMILVFLWISDESVTVLSFLLTIVAAIELIIMVVLFYGKQPIC